MLITKNSRLRKLLGAAETFNFLALKLLLRRRHKFSSYCNRVYQQYISAAGGDLWRVENLFRIFAVDEFPQVTLKYKAGGGIGTPLDEVSVLALVTATVAPARIFEIGTFKGRTALAFALNSPETCEIYTLDLPLEERRSVATGLNAADNNLAMVEHDRLDFHGTSVEAKVTQLRGNSLNYDFQAYYGTCDLIFIDGAHDYDYVVSDTRAALKMIRKGGIILWHDFGYYGDYHDVTRAVVDIVGRDRIVQVQDTCIALYRNE